MSKAVVVTLSSSGVLGGVDVAEELGRACRHLSADRDMQLSPTDAVSGFPGLWFEQSVS